MRGHKAMAPAALAAAEPLDDDARVPMKSLRSALRLLTEFMGNGTDHSVGELAESCQLSKSQVSKVLDAFVEFRILARDAETRRYCVGIRSQVLGTRFLTNDRLCQAALPIMRNLVETTGHSARLSVYDEDNGKTLYLLGVEGHVLSETGWHSGTWFPAHATTAGRVLLAFMPSEQGQELLSRPLEKFTELGTSNRKLVQKALERTRQSGYCSQRDEITRGLGTISVPIFGADTKIMAALGLAFPGHMIPFDRDQQYVEALHSAARVFSHRLGCMAYPFGATPAPARRGLAELRA